MARFFLIGILLVPIIEIAVLIRVGQSIGLFPTLGLLIGAGVLGAFLLRQQGMAALMRMRRDVSQRQVPARAVADAMMIGLAAVFLVIPGFLSDIVALALLLPPVRALIYGWLGGRFVVVNTGGPGHRGPDASRVPGPDVIDLDSDDYRPRQP